ncbi:LOW QUALITY PROTEIN: hypothetical protein CVT25_003884 [Psilocybe cyanescens]|uniref:Uncharacterized protein n=1 Tax=Psilocybe cyanescens TaxID=93625 RepID=A0A409XPP6_PSICY|nr:LOW QUALITY PROTEIN: hypothetical protein CVT25_003884 [Psilocybe cyanescens]
MSKTDAHIQPAKTYLYIACHFTQRSLAYRARVPDDMSILDVRQIVATEVATQLNLPIGEIEAAGIIIASALLFYPYPPLPMPFRDEHGFLRYDDATTMLRDLSGEQSGLHAIIPSKHNRLADEAGAPMETISENPAFLSDPLALSSQAQSATMMETLEGKLNAEPQKTTKLNEEKFREHEAIWEAELQKTTKLIEEMFREHKTWWKAELQELKELDVSAENRYQRLLNEEREERIKGDAANEAHTAAVEQLVIQKHTRFGIGVNTCDTMVGLWDATLHSEKPGGYEEAAARPRRNEAVK